MCCWSPWGELQIRTHAVVGDAPCWTRRCTTQPTLSRGTGAPWMSCSGTTSVNHRRDRPTKHLGRKAVERHDLAPVMSGRSWCQTKGAGAARGPAVVGRHSAPGSYCTDDAPVVVGVRKVPRLLEAATRGTVQVVLAFPFVGILRPRWRHPALRWFTGSPGIGEAFVATGGIDPRGLLCPGNREQGSVRPTRARH
jgi:hypothetical protein